VLVQRQENEREQERKGADEGENADEESGEEDNDESDDMHVGGNSVLAYVTSSCREVLLLLRYVLPDRTDAVRKSRSDICVEITSTGR
jgi:hypothetical protein